MGLHLISWRSVFLAAAYFVAVMVLPLLIGAFNYYNKAAIPGQPMEAPAFTGPLPHHRLPT
jgi:hypothetical protein